MSWWQWLLLGVMLGWTPAMLAIAVLLMRAAEGQGHD
jgi:hypothetical protein